MDKSTFENDATGVFDDGVENFLRMLSSNMNNWQNPTHVREVATNIVRILLMYRAEYHIMSKTQQVNTTVHQHFQNMMVSIMAESNLVDADKLVSDILQQIEHEVLRSETDPIRNHFYSKQDLYGWASLVYLREHKLHTFDSGSPRK